MPLPPWNKETVFNMSHPSACLVVKTLWHIWIQSIPAQDQIPRACHQVCPEQKYVPEEKGRELASLWRLRFKPYVENFSCLASWVHCREVRMGTRYVLLVWKGRRVVIGGGTEEGSHRGVYCGHFLRHANLREPHMQNSEVWTWIPVSSHAQCLLEGSLLRKLPVWVFCFWTVILRHPPLF